MSICEHLLLGQDTPAKIDCSLEEGRGGDWFSIK